MTENPPNPQGNPSVPPQAPQYGQPPQYGAPTYGTPPGAAPVSESDRRMWAMFAHIGAIILGFIAPLIIWAMYKDRDEFVKDQATEALNFQITVFIAAMASSILVIVLIGLLLLPLVGIADLVLCIMGGIAANRGERYRYPFALRLVK
jgi:uncharacterized Tic20 family protein